MSGVLVSKTVLAWAVGRSGKPLGVLERKIPRMRLWVRGEDRPTLRRLDDLAKAGSAPLGYFPFSSQPRERLPIVRAAGGQRPRRPSPDLLEAIQTIEAQAWLREYFLDQAP